MKVKILVGVMLFAGAAGAVIKYVSGPPPIEVLMTPPKSAGDREGGTLQIDAGPVPADCSEPSHITVLAYTSDACDGCVKLKGHLRKLVARRPDVAVRLVDLGKAWHGVDYKSLYGIDLRSVPHVVLFDAEGKVLAEDNSSGKAGLELLYEWMNAEMKRGRQ